MEKRSEYIERRAKHWRGEFPYLSNGAPARAELDAQAAEAAGIAWEPEAPGLPERLEFSENGDYIFCRQGGGEAFFLAIISEYGIWDARFADPAVIHATMTEAVRRYNAWPTIRAWAGRKIGGHRLDELIAILDGPAE